MWLPPRSLWFKPHFPVFHSPCHPSDTNGLLHPGKCAMLKKARLAITTKALLWPYLSTGERNLGGIRCVRRARVRPLAAIHPHCSVLYVQNLLPFTRLAHGSTELCLCAGGQTAPMAPLGSLPHSNDGSCSEQVPFLLKGLHLSGASISCSLLIYLFNLIELLETGPQRGYQRPHQHFPSRHVTSQQLVGCALLRQHRWH